MSGAQLSRHEFSSSKMHLFAAAIALIRLECAQFGHAGLLRIRLHQFGQRVHRFYVRARLDGTGRHVTLIILRTDSAGVRCWYGCFPGWIRGDGINKKKKKFITISSELFRFSTREKFRWFSFSVFYFKYAFLHWIFFLFFQFNIKLSHEFLLLMQFSLNKVPKLSIFSTATVSWKMFLFISNMPKI